MSINNLPKIDEFEEWKPYYEDPEHYFISNYGRVYSTWVERIMEPRKKKTGYLYVGIHKGEGHKAFNRYVHRMVAMMFKPNPNGYKVVMHSPDPDVSNCRADNVIWGSQKQNVQECIAQGRSKCNSSWGGDIRAMYVQTGEQHIFTDYSELTKVTGVKRQSAYCAIRDGRTTKGWKFFR